MSGKGKHPRVKGNLKPTSSSRAADLLGSDMTAINAFKANPALAFSQLTRNTPVGSGTQSGVSTPESTSRSSTPGPALDQIDGQLAAQLKRLGKQDSKTKMRALFELKSYVMEHQWSNGLEGMMLAWPPLFKRHIFDPDRRVRTALSNVNSLLVQRVGKRLAPNLRQLIAPWVASYFDPHKEVAKNSKDAFGLVFPQSKRKEVYNYCLEELVKFSVDNILNQTPETLSDVRFTDKEEMKNKYEQVIGASFGILGLVVEEADKEKLREHKNSFDLLLVDKKTHAFVCHSSTLIRRSVYRFIRSVMLKCPELVNDTYEPLARSLLSNAFLDKDPAAHGDMWDAVLLTTKCYPKSWINTPAPGQKPKQPLIEGFLDFLGDGCHIAPKISYPSLLALLANLPSEIVDSEDFQVKFHRSVWHNIPISEDENNGSKQATKSATQTSQSESVALINAVCECFSFLWTRTMKKLGKDSVSNVGTIASREIDKLLHFYLLHHDIYKEIEDPIITLFCKLETLSTKYDTTLLDKIWAQASWFALRRLSGAAIIPIIHMIVKISLLDSTKHAALTENANKLLVAFCQLALQSQEEETMKKLIQSLVQLAPEIVFNNSFAEKFSAKLDDTGAYDEAVSLIISRSQFIYDTTGSLQKTMATLDMSVSHCSKAALSGDGAASAYMLVHGLLVSLPTSSFSADDEWSSKAALPSLDIMLVSSIANIPTNQSDILTSSVPSPSQSLIQLCCQSLLSYFSGIEVITESTVDKVFEWMEGVFKLQYDIQLARDVSASVCLDGWIDSAHEVLKSWTTLSRDANAGPRFVRFWLKRSDNLAQSALGLLFDFAISKVNDSSDDEDEDGQSCGISRTSRHKLYPQAKRAWSATVAQIEKLHLGSTLSKTLGNSIARDLNDLRGSKNPTHLARLATSIFTRVCPQDDKETLSLLIFDWLVDKSEWEGALAMDAHTALGEDSDDATERYLCLCTSPSSLSQSVDDYTSCESMAFRKLTHWNASSDILKDRESSNTITGSRGRFDAYGLSRFARRALFAADFIQLSGGLSVLSDYEGVGGTATLSVYMALAHVLFNESVLSARNAYNNSDGSGVELNGPCCSGVIMLENDDNSLLDRINRTTKTIEDLFSDLLGLVVVHGLSVPRSNGSGDISEESHAINIKVPHDSGRWLGTLINEILNTTEANSNKDNGDEENSIWKTIINTCIERHIKNPSSQWASVLGTLVSWCQWTDPVGSADIEALAAVPLSQNLTGIYNEPSLLELVVVTARAVNLRYGCPQSPALRGALIDLVGHLTQITERCNVASSKQAQDQAVNELIIGLELLGELMPPHQASLDTSTTTPKLLHIMFAIPEIIADIGDNGSSSSLTLILASMLTMHRFVIGLPAIEDSNAVGLARLCLKWLYTETPSDENANVVLVAISRAVSSLSVVVRNLIEDPTHVVGPIMKQIGDRLVEACLLSEKPVPEGIRTISVLVRTGFYDTPEFPKLYPVLTNATPRLDIELVCLILASPYMATDIGSNTRTLIELINVAASALDDLGVPHAEFGEGVEGDDYVRSAGFRLLITLELVLYYVESVVSLGEKYEQIAGIFSNEQILDNAMPWICALLGLDGHNTTTYEPRMWDPTGDIDWVSWIHEFEHNPTGTQLFRVLAHHIIYKLSWLLPSTLRTWWAGLSQAHRATSIEVEKFITKNISPLVIKREIHRITLQQNVNGEDGESDNDNDESDNGSINSSTIDDLAFINQSGLTNAKASEKKPADISTILEEYDDAAIKAASSQVMLTYTVDDSTLEIVLKIPASYPLSLPVFESVKRVAVTEKRWRAWLVSAQAQLARNRRLDTVCAQVLGNIGAHFAGVEDCAICYSAVGVLDNSLPTKQCKTCKNKFHRMCLFKWFSTSNQSTCPLCRNLF